MEAKEYTLKDLLQIIADLRGPDGCPWDKVQTHASLKQCMTEEAAEVLAAIRILEKTGNAENLCEELGDVLLQVIMHSQIAEEEGLFTFDDVINQISRKMVRRHPHVFGETEVDSAETVLRNWDDIKQKETEGKDWISGPLREIPIELPALSRAPKILKKVNQLYEPVPKMEETLGQLKKSVSELETEETANMVKSADAETKEQVKKVVGQALWEICNLSRICKISPEEALLDKIERILDKYEP